PRVLEHAIVDAINVYVRDVLIPRGLVDGERYGDAAQELDRLKHDVARRWAENWKVCQMDVDEGERR
ncbi:MAG TPA: hypothetical protein VF796_14855, partial [Humisphaera sp.]